VKSQQTIETKKNFLIGVGSQRAGSTLLYRVLSRSVRGLFMHPVKELHVFDSLYRIRPPQELKRFSSHQLQRLTHKYGDLEKAQKTANKHVICEIRANTILSERDISEVNYLDLYRPCLMHYNWLGEVTPEYMLLSEAQLRDMQKQLKGRVVPILMARNPMKRFISAFKLRHFYMRPSGQEAISNGELVSDLNTLLDHRHEDGWMKAQLRFNMYSSAQQRLQAVFGDASFTLSLDALLQNPEQALQAISERTGLEVDMAAAEACMQQKVNETDIQLNLDETTQDRLNEVFSESIREAEDLCGNQLRI